MAVTNSNKTLTVLEDSVPYSGNLVDDVSYTITGFTIAGQAGPFVLGTAYNVANKGSIQIDSDGDYIFDSANDFYGSFPVVSVTVTDGVDSVVSTLSITVNPVSDAPVSSNATIFLLEDSVYNFSSNDFSITDVDGDALKSVKIKSLPAKGILKLGANTVVVNQVINAGVLGTLTFTPTANQFGVPYTNFTYSIIDEGSLANSGVTESVANYTVTVNVISINDEPSAAEAGWVAGDATRILIAMNLPMGKYQFDQMNLCMNQVAEIDPTTVQRIRTLLEQWDTAQAALTTGNITSDGRTLVKADVLEWESNKDGSSGPEAEIARVVAQLYQYFSFCPVCSNGRPFQTTTLIRS